MKIRTLFTLAIVGIMSAAFIGCQTKTQPPQIINSTSGNGVSADMSVPVPGTSYNIGAKLAVGAFNNTTIVNPTSTNGVVNSGQIVVAVTQEGKQNVSGNTGGTNSASANAGIANGSKGASVVATGGAGARNQTTTNDFLIVHGNTNAPAK